MTLEQRIERLEMLVGLKENHGDTRLVNILSVTASAFSRTPAEMLEKSRILEFIQPRHVFCWLARRDGFAFHSIGRFIDRDHATVMHACAAVESRMDTEMDFAAQVNQLAATLNIK